MVRIDATTSPGKNGPNHSHYHNCHFIWRNSHKELFIKTCKIIIMQYQPNFYDFEAVKALGIADPSVYDFKKILEW